MAEGGRLELTKAVTPACFQDKYLFRPVNPPMAESTRFELVSLATTSLAKKRDKPLLQLSNTAS